MDSVPAAGQQQEPRFPCLTSHVSFLSYPTPILVIGGSRSLSGLCQHRNVQTLGTPKAVLCCLTPGLDFTLFKEELNYV